MPVRIVLDHPNTIWTNFDQINGKVLLRLDGQSSITSIVVKLEGESRTKLLAPSPMELDRRPRPHEEFHKVGPIREGEVVLTRKIPCEHRPLPDHSVWLSMTY